MHHDLSPGSIRILIIPAMKPVGQQKEEKAQEASAQFERACDTCPCKAVQRAE